MEENSPQLDKENRPEDKFRALKKETEKKYGLKVTENVDGEEKSPKEEQKDDKKEEPKIEPVEEFKEEPKEDKPKKEFPKVKIPKISTDFKKISKFGLIPLFFLLVLAGYSFIIHKLSLKYYCINCEIKELEIFNPFGTQLDSISFGVEAFGSKEEFIEYIESAGSEEMGLFGAALMPQMLMAREATDSIDPGGSITTGSFGAPGGASPSRVSTTNVQVVGIDEPDIVKTDGQNIFTSIQEGYYYDRSGTANSATNIIKAFPPSELEKIGGIDKIGNLLLSKNVLIIFTAKEVFGYDVLDPYNPKELWKMPYEEKTGYKDARMYQDEIYLITATAVNRHDPCPLRPVILEGQDFSIPCTEIYHPKRNIPINVTYSILNIDPQSGEVKDSVSLVGSEFDAVIYMSEDNLYVSYSYREDYTEIYLDFINTAALDLFSEEFVKELEDLVSYELSSGVKMMELMYRIESYTASLSEDEMMRVSNELENRLDSYTKEHARDYETTGIVKIGRKDLDIDATGTVPGHPLNQFSLDEYDNNLRIATNSGGAMWGAMGDVNDVYILNRNMREIGKVTDLGKDERIYAARFIRDKAYIVTFREIDPFYVLDLSDPRNPQMKGELKIPGYSSYLHPLRDNVILGIGKEGSQVKLSMFDVSDPGNPAELDKYMLDEYWSEVANNHHAFLLDPVHEIFFLPGSKGAYIFSYANNKLSLAKTDSAVNVKRAIYLDDYLYIITDSKIVVLDEKTWALVKEIEYNPSNQPKPVPPIPLPIVDF